MHPKQSKMVQPTQTFDSLVKTSQQPIKLDAKFLASLSCFTKEPCESSSEYCSQESTIDDTKTSTLLSQEESPEFQTKVATQAQLPAAEVDCDPLLSVFVWNLPLELSNESFLSLYSCYGEVSSAYRLITKKGKPLTCGYVHFKFAAGSERCLEAGKAVYKEEEILCKQFERVVKTKKKTSKKKRRKRRRAKKRKEQKLALQAKLDSSNQEEIEQGEAVNQLADDDVAGDDHIRQSEEAVRRKEHSDGRKDEQRKTGPVDFSLIDGESVHELHWRKPSEAGYWTQRPQLLYNNQSRWGMSNYRLNFGKFKNEHFFYNHH
jgi:hypothetical protein